MPFYTKRMVRYLEGKDPKKKKHSHGKDKDKDKEKSDSGKEKGLRVAPSGISGAKPDAKASGAAVPQTEVLTTAPAEPIKENFDEKRLLFQKGLLKASVERIQKEKPALPVKHRYFARYTIQKEEQPIGESQKNSSKVFKAQHQEFKDNVLACKIYEGQHNINANDSLHLKILRTLGKKHPNIIQTWDVFHNAETNEIFVFQELANRGNLEAYLQQNQCDEQQAGKWLWQIFKGLDYLGDLGISHRGLSPKHVLLSHKDLRIKLSGFEMSALYWDATKEDVKNVPCLPLDSRPKDYGSYDAPEVYGDPSKEEFDPLVADVWSFGAVGYFMMTKNYPYEFASPDATAVQQIQPNIDKIEGLSAEGKKFLSETLKPMAVERKHIDKLAADDWLKKFK